MTMQQRDVEVWLFLQRSKLSKQAKNFIEADCTAKGWKLSIRHTTEKRNPKGRPVFAVSKEDAINLYKRMHRARVGVCQIGKADAPVSARPRRFDRDYVSLSRYVKHKAYHWNLPQTPTLAQWTSSLSDFYTWLDKAWCDGEADPRCLPLHVFRTEIDIDTLDTQEGRQNFQTVHGSQSSRKDINQLQWNRPRGAFHGRDILHIAGRELVQGFHWDVSSGNMKRKLNTTAGTWEIKPNGYLNVYPDAYVREGKRVHRIKIKQ